MRSPLRLAAAFPSCASPCSPVSAPVWSPRKTTGSIFPRTIVQVPDTRFFVVADMGGWDPKKGRLLLLDPAAPERTRIKVLLRGLDVPHGLAVGIDRRIYAGVVDRIFRFDPLAADPAVTVETIVQGLPGFKPKLADGTTLPRNLHPLKHFVFDRTGRLFVNIGAPSDACATSKSETKPCAAGEGAFPLAAVWMFTPPAGGIFPALKAGDANPPHEVFARGLRNSMALAVHPRFPDEGFPLLQGENARDLPEANRPNEELNALERGKHYGWPYCYDLSTVSTEYAAFLKKRRALPRSLQQRGALPATAFADGAARRAARHALLSGRQIPGAQRQAHRRAARLSSRPAADSSSMIPMRAAFRRSSLRQCATM